MASGDTLLIFTPLGNESPSSAYATLDLRNSHPVLDFDDATNEYAVFTSILPRAYSGGGLTVSVFFAMSSAVSGDVVWTFWIERIGEIQDIDSDGFATEYYADPKTVSGTSGIPVKVVRVLTDGTRMDHLAVGEPFRLKIRRTAESEDDTASGDAELLAVEIKET